MRTPQGNLVKVIAGNCYNGYGKKPTDIYLKLINPINRFRQFRKEKMEIPEFVKGEIYVIVNKLNNKKYVGQTRTHVWNHGKYRPFGSLKRWQAHVSEAIGNYKHQSAKLNNAIRKYGRDAFEVTIVETCELYELNSLESAHIEEFDSIRNGYNLTSGGDKANITEQGKISISNTLLKFFDDKKKEKYSHLKPHSIHISLLSDIDKQLVQVYLKLENKSQKVDFGGKKRSLEESIERAKHFALSFLSKDKITLSPKIKDLLAL